MKKEYMETLKNYEMLIENDKELIKNAQHYIAVGTKATIIKQAKEMKKQALARIWKNERIVENMKC